MISQADLDRALARWKVRQQGGEPAVEMAEGDMPVDEQFEASPAQEMNQVSSSGIISVTDLDGENN